jgi:hypothetical protein
MVTRNNTNVMMAFKFMTSVRHRGHTSSSSYSTRRSAERSTLHGPHIAQQRKDADGSRA